MELVPIGEAARMLKVNASALRYYEERGLVKPACRVNGRRMYGRAELRRLAFVHMAQTMGFRLDVIREALDEPGERWREAIRRRIADLDELIARAERAKRFLAHALECPAEDPVQDCPTLTEALDRQLAGENPAEIATEHLGPAVPHTPVTAAEPT
ncbi:MAG: MerR family transcriptional regulator [Actinomycetes bacterium]|jgi:DNA-binding transcriptional MerR regulator|nr:MAG: MerR family transcriptional regulator [Actinomycetota bacterium]